MIKNEKDQVLEHWNSKKIIVHKKINGQLDTELDRIGKYYSVEEIKEYIDFYATILEPDVDEKDRKYFWSYEWNLYEFLYRGIRKFDGQKLKNYLRKQKVVAPKAIIFKRK